VLVSMYYFCQQGMRYIN